MGGEEERKTMIRIYHIKKDLFSTLKKKKRKEGFD